MAGGGHARRRFVHCSDCSGEFGEGGWESVTGVEVSGEFIMAPRSQCRSSRPMASRRRFAASWTLRLLRGYEAIDSASASAMTLSFSWEASSARRLAFSSSTTSSSVRTLATV